MQEELAAGVRHSVGCGCPICAATAIPAGTLNPVLTPNAPVSASTSTGPTAAMAPADLLSGEGIGGLITGTAWNDEPLEVGVIVSGAEGTAKPNAANDLGSRDAQSGLAAGAAGEGPGTDAPKVGQFQALELIDVTAEDANILHPDDQ
jgi:hypothetical protein